MSKHSPSIKGYSAYEWLLTLDLIFSIMLVTQPTIPITKKNKPSMNRIDVPINFLLNVI